MAKVRFYVDVPEYAKPDWPLFAHSTQPTHALTGNLKRVAFDVEMPPGVWKPFDIPAQASNAHIVISDEPEETP